MHLVVRPIERVCISLRFLGSGSWISEWKAVTTDPVWQEVSRASSTTGRSFQQQGYTNKGIIMGDWIGREAKGGQAWLTYHLSGNEWVQLQYLQQKESRKILFRMGRRRTSSRRGSEAAWHKK